MTENHVLSAHAEEILARVLPPTAREGLAGGVAVTYIWSLYPMSFAHVNTTLLSLLVPERVDDAYTKKLLERVTHSLIMNDLDANSVRLLFAAHGRVSTTTSIGLSGRLGQEAQALTLLPGRGSSKFVPKAQVGTLIDYTSIVAKQLSTGQEHLRTEAKMEVERIFAAVAELLLWAEKQPANI